MNKIYKYPTIKQVNKLIKNARSIYDKDIHFEARQRYCGRIDILEVMGKKDMHSTLGSEDIRTLDKLLAPLGVRILFEEDYLTRSDFTPGQDC